jgi:hypothetical protein
MVALKVEAPCHHRNRLFLHLTSCVHFADDSIKVLEKFCGPNLTTKKGNARLNMYLVEKYIIH